jgi:hypothetical protein
VGAQETGDKANDNHDDGEEGQVGAQETGESNK